MWAANAVRRMGVVLIDSRYQVEKQNYLLCSVGHLSS